MGHYILIVEDEENRIAEYVRQLNNQSRGTLKPLIACNLVDALNLLREKLTIIAGIIVDGAVPITGKGSETKLTTIPLIQAAKHESSFQGPIIAASGSDAYRATMLQYGCTHGVEKYNAVNTLLKALTE